MKALIITFPGTNCDTDLEKACKVTGFEVEKIWHTQKKLQKADVVFLPGGFSYGDYISAGRVAKFSPIIEEIKNIISQKNTFIVGICNGFQILCEIKALPGALLLNSNNRFINSNEPLMQNDQEITLPVAHIEGRFWANDEQLQEIEDNNMVFLKYIKDINGSLNNIAGLYDRENKVIGLMPHPERAVFAELGLSDGFHFFEFLKREINNAR